MKFCRAEQILVFSAGWKQNIVYDCWETYDVYLACEGTIMGIKLIW